MILDWFNTESTANHKQGKSFDHVFIQKNRTASADWLKNIPRPMGKIQLQPYGQYLHFKKSPNLKSKLTEIIDQTFR